MKIAITGGSGFVGIHLKEELKRRNLSFMVLDRDKHSLFEPTTLKNFVSSSEIIIHLAGANRDNNFNLLKVNTLGTLGLLEAIVRYSPKTKLIFSSSSQVYLGGNMYSLSKKFAEELIELYTRQNAMKAIVLRISNIYGPGCKPFYNSVIATFAYLLKKGGPLTINGDGTQKRDYIYVGDVVTALIKSIEYNPRNTCEYFDICSGKLISLNSIVKTLGSISSQEIEIRYNRQSKFSEKEVKQDYKKAEHYLSWRLVTDLKTGLTKTLELA